MLKAIFFDAEMVALGVYAVIFTVIASISVIKKKVDEKNDKDGCRKRQIEAYKKVTGKEIQ